MDDITIIKNKILAAVLEREEDILAMQTSIQAIIDASTETFRTESLVLQEKYAASNGSGEDFMRELKSLQDRIAIHTQQELDRLLAEVSAAR